jgi:hypothetical protein
MKIHKPQKRTIQIRNQRYFLDFPEIMENNDEYAIKIGGKFYYLPLPNIFENNSVCNGDAGAEHFWTSEFTKIYLDLPDDRDHTNDFRYEFYDTWQKEGFDSIKKEIPEIPFYASINFIDNPSHKDKLDAINQYFYAIKYFPDANSELKKAAILKSEEAIIYIRNTEEQDIIHHLNLYKSLKYINRKYMTYAIKKNAIDIDSYNIDYMVGPTLEKDLALMAVKKDGMLYQSIAFCEHLCNDKEIQIEAIRNNPLAIQFIQFINSEEMKKFALEIAERRGENIVNQIRSFYK